MCKIDHAYDLREIPLEYVRVLCEQFHGYGSAGKASAYAFGVWEGNSLVAAYAWQPPPPGAALAVCPEAPQGVLALSRMVAVPRDRRRLNHVSRLFWKERHDGHCAMPCDADAALAAFMAERE